jgi:O-antigen ligase
MADRGNPTLSLVSRSLAFSIPAFLGIYWPLYILAPSVVPMALRCSILASALALLVLWYRSSLTHVESKFLFLFGMLFLALVIPSLTATDVSRAFTDVVKLAVVCVIGLALARSLRDVRTAKAFGYGMLISSLLPTFLIVAVYIRHMGLTIPTYQQLRILKGLLAKHEGIALNPIAFTSLFMFIVGLCLVRPTKFIWSLGAFVFLVSALLTGSRAPIGVTLLSFIVLLGWGSLHSKSLLVRVSGWLLVLAVALVTTGTILMINSKTIESLTEGRSDLWTVAWEKFLERPITGYGYESWRDDLISRRPGLYALTGPIAIQTAGGYHNQYLTILAEDGLIVFIPALAIFWSLLRECHRLAKTGDASMANGRIIMMAGLFLLLRAGVEAPGLLGYGQEPADYLAYCFLAVVISQISIQESAARPTGAGALSRRVALAPEATGA